MQANFSRLKNGVFKLVLSSLIFGFLAVGVASASDVADSSGGWTEKDYAIQGTWSIEQRGDEQVITLSDDFSTKSGPDLKIFLSPKTVEDVTGKTATEGSVLVSVLKSNKGSQEYVLPADVDLKDYKSMLIHCEEYSVLWGGTDL